MIVRTFRQNFLRTLENLNPTNLIDLIYYYFFSFLGRLKDLILQKMKESL